MRRCVILSILALSAIAWGQGSVSTATPIAFDQNGHILQNALVAICAKYPGATPVPPCGEAGNSLITLYTDITLGTACSGSAGSPLNNVGSPSVGAGCSNPGTPNNGNVVAYAPAGAFWCEYYGSGLVTQVLPCPFLGSALSNFNNIIYVDGTTYPKTIAGIQSAANACAALNLSNFTYFGGAPGCTVVVSGGNGSYPGTTGLTVEQGTSLVSLGGYAELSITGLGSTTDGLTVTCNGTNALGYRTTIDGFNLAMNQSGRDAIRLNCGDHTTLQNLRIQDAGRDFIEIKPDASNHWIENLKLSNIKTFVQSPAGGSLRDSIHFELPTGLSGIFINNTVAERINIRGYVRNAWRFEIDDTTDGANANITGFVCNSCDDDGFGIAAATTNAVAYVKGAGVSNNVLGLQMWLNGGHEDTVNVHSVPAITVPVNFVLGMKIIGTIASFFTSVPTNNPSGALIDTPANVSGLKIGTQADERGWGELLQFAPFGINVPEISGAFNFFGSNPWFQVHTNPTNPNTDVIQIGYDSPDTALRFYTDNGGTNAWPFHIRVSPTGNLEFASGSTAPPGSETVSEKVYFTPQGGGSFSGSQFVGLTDGATITWAIASNQFANAAVTIAGNRTLALTGLVNGGSYVLRVTQDGTGSRTLTLGTGCTWKVGNGGAGAVTLSTAAGANDFIAFTYDGTVCWTTLTKNFN
jgi:hypothetical protein